MRYDPEARVVLVDAAGAEHPATVKPMELRHRNLFERWLAWGSRNGILVVFLHWPAVIERAQDEGSGVIGFACEAVGELQGLIALWALGKVIHVEYLETAPWNRQPPGSAAGFRGVGTQLLCQAIAFSDHRGRAGSIELSSLDASSDKFYDKIGMEIVGSDAYQQTIYRFGAQAAQEFYRQYREE